MIKPRDQHAHCRCPALLQPSTSTVPKSGSAVLSAQQVTRKAQFPELHKTGPRDSKTEGQGSDRRESRMKGQDRGERRSVPLAPGSCPDADTSTALRAQALQHSPLCFLGFSSLGQRLGKGWTDSTRSAERRGLGPAGQEVCIACKRTRVQPLAPYRVLQEGCQSTEPEVCLKCHWVCPERDSYQ